MPRKRRPAIDRAFVTKGQSRLTWSLMVCLARRERTSQKKSGCVTAHRLSLTISGRETFLPELTSQRFGPLQQGIEHNRWNAQTRVNFIELAQFV